MSTVMFHKAREHWLLEAFACGLQESSRYIFAKYLSIKSLQCIPITNVSIICQRKKKKEVCEDLPG